jgi:hypothetical protein
MWRHWWKKRSGKGGFLLQRAGNKERFSVSYLQIFLSFDKMKLITNGASLPLVVPVWESQRLKSQAKREKNSFYIIK